MTPSARAYTWTMGFDSVRRAAVRKARVFLVLGAALATAGPQCASGSSALDGHQPTAPSGLDTAAILADSSIRYESSGGFAGFFSGASFVAKNGVVSVEYRPPFGRASSEPRRATLPSDDYVSLWRQIEQSGLRSVPSTGEPDPRGADRIRNAIEARLGQSTTQLIWMDDEPPARPRDLPTLVETVVNIARKAVGEP